MRKFCSFFFLMVLFGCAVPQSAPVADPLRLPQIGGTLTSDTTLNGQYLLVADLRVPTGLTLTIEPGTIVYVQPSDSTKIDPEFLSRETEVLIGGTLMALGTEAQPIVFKPFSEDRDAILWSGLQLVDSKQSRLEHLVVEQAEAGLLCLNASPQVQSLHVRRSRYGVLLQRQSAPIIKDSLLIDGEAGLFCWDQSAPEVRDIRIVDHQEEGVYLGRECRGRFVGNLIRENDRGVVLPVGVSFDESNLVTGNRLDFIRYAPEVE